MNLFSLLMMTTEEASQGIPYNPEHWFFVWLSYGIVTALVILLIVGPVVRRKQVNQSLKLYYQRKQLLDKEQGV
ncbi:heme exporter protein CcmD [Pleionea sp. CnH1-48]|uniref:heme exporter protein CcmD n=1 Tax=Pleionea sp. CnH1-48 TaxID=2954494 RepID=UPI002097A4F5|nr:heme exporter protein CcmD [Pleionea sp. CnH1-48]MCO7223616.1 heme exporter protein CcmD [Pleionea sp. CnH1-48]